MVGDVVLFVDFFIIWFGCSCYSFCIGVGVVFSRSIIVIIGVDECGNSYKY